MIDEAAPKAVQLPVESDVDRAARLRHERFLKIGVVEAPAYLPEDQYRRDFRGRTWFMSQAIKEQAEECLRVCFCPKCMEFDERTGRIVATRFFVRFMADPMQQFLLLAHLNCHGCGFEEYYPLKHDPRKTRDHEEKTAYAIQQRAQEAREQLAHLQANHTQLIETMMRETAQRLGLPSNMIQSESEAMRRILERQQMTSPPTAPPVAKGLGRHPTNEEWADIARAIKDPEARRQYVNLASKYKGIT